MVDGVAFNVTRNLEVALQHLIYEIGPGGIWVDFVCINQQKKGEQVQLMKFIYQAADKSLMWLGPSSDNSDLIIDILAELGKKACEFELPNTKGSGREIWPK